MKRVLPLLLILIFGTLFALLLLNPAEHEDVSIEMLPPLTLTTETGATLQLPILGRPVIVNVFASWCVPCAAEMPLLAKLKDSGIPIYGIAYKEQPPALAGFLSRYGNPFIAIALDDGAATTQLGITGVPESYLVDAQGRVVRHSPGMLDERLLADWQAEIAAWH